MAGRGARSKRCDSGLADSCSSDDESVESQQRKSRGKPSARQRDDDKVKVGIDLTNPDDLLNKMDKLQLTEEETEELLKQAYKINRQLKQEMRSSDDSADRRFARSAGAKSSKGGRLPPIGSSKRRSNDQPGNPRSASKRSAKPRPEWVD